jgi:hypothetical protein
MMAAVELSAEVCDRQPRVAALLALGVRAAGVFVRPGGTAVAVSPPLTAVREHFELIAQAIEQWSEKLRLDGGDDDLDEMRAGISDGLVEGAGELFCGVDAP